MNPNLTKGSMQTYSDDASDEADDKDMPLGIGDLADDQALDPLAGSGERKRINTGSLVLVGVVLVACGGLFFMRSISQVNSAAGANTDLEKRIETYLKGSKDPSKSTNALLQGGAGAISALTGDYMDRQVPLNSVARDPFRLPEEDHSPTAPVDDSAKNNLAVKRAARQSVMEQAASRFELKSVIMSSTPLANISGKIIRQGDELVVEQDKVAFRVANITSDSVTIVASDEQLDLVVSINLVLKRDR